MVYVPRASIPDGACSAFAVKDCNSFFGPKLPTMAVLLSTATQHQRGVTTETRGGSLAEWLACWTQAQKGLGSKSSRNAVG